MFFHYVNPVNPGVKVFRQVEQQKILQEATANWEGRRAADRDIRGGNIPFLPVKSISSIPSVFSC
jgi:hypothetical protein